MKRSRRRSTGASIAHWILALIPIALVGVFALDFNNIYVVQAELQRAADAGALAGAKLLYDSNGELFDTTASPTAIESAAQAVVADAWNNSEGEQIELESVTPGHWTFRSVNFPATGVERGGEFVVNNNADTASLFDPSTNDFRPLIDGDMDDDGVSLGECLYDADQYVGVYDVNSDTCDINAVQVVVEREQTPIESLIALVFPGLYQGTYETSATAVAYVGFAGTVEPDELDLPIALCEHLLTKSGEWNCSVGRMSSSSTNDEGAAKWTDLTADSCSASSNNEVGNVLDQMPCLGGSGITHNELGQGDGVNVLGEAVGPNLVRDFQDCFRTTADTDSLFENSLGAATAGVLDPNYQFPDEPLTAKAPVIDCDDAQNSSCNPLFSAVEVQVIWVNANNAQDNRIPTKMTNVDGYSDWDIFTGRETDRFGNCIPIPTTSTTDTTGTCMCSGTAVTCNRDSSYPAGTFQNISPIPTEYEYHARVWDSFADHFDIEYLDQADDTLYTAWYRLDNVNPATGFRTNTVYFSPKCESIPLGGTGGTIPFTRAKIPVLVY